MLSTNQDQVVQCEENCIVVACPGSGKTKVLVHKVEHILNLYPNAIILITTFTKDSAKEIHKRIFDVIGDKFSNQVIVGTFHSIALKQIKRKNFNGKIIQAADVSKYIERSLDECNIFDITLNQAKQYIEESMVNPNYVAPNNNYGRLFEYYSSMLARINVFDFSHILSKSVSMMKAGKLQPIECQYLLTDESQDLDEMQYEWCSAHIKYGAIFTIVGDDDQSIYKFRHALGYQGMMRFTHEFGAKVIKLDTNYRCKSEILSAANKVISNNTHRVDKKLVSSRGPGGEIEIWQTYDPADETHLVVQKIIELSSSSPDSNLVNIENGEWAVLARNNHLLQIISMGLRAHSIPHTETSKNLWIEDPVCFALSVLSSLLTQHKAGYDTALYFEGLDEKTLIAIHAEYEDKFSDIFKVNIKLYPEKFDEVSIKIVHNFSKLVQYWLQEISAKHYNNVICGVFDWLNFKLEAACDDNSKKNKYINDEKILAAAKKILSNMKGSLSDRLFKVMLPPKKDNKENTNSVFLGTMHGSKGLEFKNVWLLQINDGVIPNCKKDNLEIIEEERRLFYVGMTRAKDRLFISCSVVPSIFVHETKVRINQYDPIQSKV